MPSTIAQPSPYRLANHVRACRIDEQVVLLDMQRNKYLGVGGAQLATLSQFIVDWPSNPGRAMPELTAAGTDTFLNTLRADRMLVDAGTTGRSNAFLDEPRETFPIDLTGSPWRWRDALDLARAASVVTFWMKWRSLADMAESVARRRLARQSRGDHSTSAELDAAVWAYLRLRPFVHTAHDQCLRDSLTLIHFLASKNMYPSWVIGVRTRPFTAHSWAQLGGLVLNDLHEHVRDYTPILVV